MKNLKQFRTEDKTVLFDGDTLLYKVAIFNKETTDKENVCKSFLNVFNETLSKIGQTKYIFYITEKNNFRKEISADYKANRKDIEKPKHLELLRNYAKITLNCKYKDYYEADDLIAIDTTFFPADSFIIANVDKDLDQLEGTHYNYNKNKFYTVTKLEAIKNFYKQCLIGDIVDNIKCANKIGVVKASKIIDNLETEEDMICAVYNTYLEKGQNIDNFLTSASLLFLIRDYEDTKGEGIKNKILNSLKNKGLI